MLRLLFVENVSSSWVLFIKAKYIWLQFSYVFMFFVRWGGDGTEQQQTFIPMLDRRSPYNVSEGGRAHRTFPPIRFEGIFQRRCREESISLNKGAISSSPWRNICIAPARTLPQANIKNIFYKFYIYAHGWPRHHYYPTQKRIPQSSMSSSAYTTHLLQI